MLKLVKRYYLQTIKLRGKVLCGEISGKIDSEYISKRTTGSHEFWRRILWKSFWSIFCYPIESAGLVHGDYNMWNIMISKDWNVSAIIDPCGCCYGDNEYDLYQLNNANGKEYGLLEMYKSKKAVSPNCDIKLAFYEVFTEIMHYYDSKVEPNIELLQTQCLELVRQMDIYGIDAK